jgi:hypothetical protein
MAGLECVQAPDLIWLGRVFCFVFFWRTLYGVRAKLSINIIFITFIRLPRLFSSLPSPAILCSRSDHGEIFLSHSSRLCFIHSTFVIKTLRFVHCFCHVQQSIISSSVQPSSSSPRTSDDVVYKTHHERSARMCVPDGFQSPRKPLSCSYFSPRKIIIYVT